MTESSTVEVKEGRATILFPSRDEVFYNPVQQFNRDLSILAIRTWADLRSPKTRVKSAHRHKKLDDPVEENLSSKENKKSVEKETSIASEKDNSPKDVETDSASTVTATDSTKATEELSSFTILEALSATGLRAIRYAHEIPNVKRVLANDLLADAVANIEKNVAFNNVQNIVIPNKGDANVVMHMNKLRYDVIDLDPYGSAAPFLDAAVQSVSNNGLLCITCTDSAVLAGNAYPEKCFSAYGGSSLRSQFCHEQAVRHLLYAIAMAAAKYGRAIVPLLSLSIDFYFRVFVRVEVRPARVKLLQSQSMLVYHCSGCGSYATQYMGRTAPAKIPGTLKYTNASGPPVGESCAHCNHRHHIGGPLWGGPLHDKTFVQNMRKLAETLDPEVYGTKRRVLGMLAVADEELTDVPLYFILSQISGILHSQVPPQNTFVSALLNAGYHVSGSHARSGAIKTDAPWAFVWDVLRTWIKEHPVKQSNINDASPGAEVLRKEITHKVDFTLHPDAEFASKKAGYTRYQMNPTENWGPKSRAGKRKHESPPPPTAVPSEQKA
ncbi:N2,N2-dimethylguanosine tRNA methyltransferase [Schizosaccharomyces japonicus yFS275]|uniref:tRNA (guanine(26)-N(2))-dimethyltransferase n=1 Tax=Schizosaccharomyces japonicus (strain yFS275 / FY16936) TaxID=402676 RepID=B6JWW1_SCHJY|nr:N2,N2-dimethylguanosine tRNA methyltransferase [Schizosaccharomyces japonicus yFS275]EEB05862.1 N2,N2-dimethylguanosine tRNA methyltransferase [Schizosaccharomyces japonicus yFS275]